MTEYDGVAAAFADAITTCDATTVVYVMVFGVKAGRFAISGTKSAIDAFVGIDVNFKPTETADESQKRANRTNRVAIGSSAAPCENNDGNKGNDGNDKSGQAFQPNIRVIKRVAVEMLS